MAAGIATCYCLFFCLLGRCYCPAANGIATILFLFVMADVIAQWQMEWPLLGVHASLQVCVKPRGLMDMGSLFKFQFSGVMQNLIPYMRQMVLAYVLI